MSSSRTGDLAAIIRLEFYRKQKRWKFRNGARKEKAVKPDLNQTYSVARAVAGPSEPSLNDAFLESSDKILPTSDNSIQVLPVNETKSCPDTSRHPNADDLTAKTVSQPSIVPSKKERFKCPKKRRSRSLKPAPKPAPKNRNFAPRKDVWSSRKYNRKNDPRPLSSQIDAEPCKQDLQSVPKDLTPRKTFTDCENFSKEQNTLSDKQNNFSKEENYVFKEEDKIYNEITDPNAIILTNFRSISRLGKEPLPKVEAKFTASQRLKELQRQASLEQESARCSQPAPPQPASVPGSPEPVPESSAPPFPARPLSLSPLTVAVWQEMCDQAGGEAMADIVDGYEDDYEPPDMGVGWTQDAPTNQPINMEVMSSSRTGDLAAIIRLEFYRKQKRWKFRNGARKEKAVKPDLNQTYSVARAVAGPSEPSLNDAFLESSDKILPTSDNSIQVLPVNETKSCPDTSRHPNADDLTAKTVSQPSIVPSKKERFKCPKKRRSRSLKPAPKPAPKNRNFAPRKDVWSSRKYNRKNDPRPLSSQIDAEPCKQDLQSVPKDLTPRKTFTDCENFSKEQNTLSDKQNNFSKEENYVFKEEDKIYNEITDPNAIILTNFRSISRLGKEPLPKVEAKFTASQRLKELQRQASLEQESARCSQPAPPQPASVPGSPEPVPESSAPPFPARPLSLSPLTVAVWQEMCDQAGGEAMADIVDGYEDDYEPPDMGVGWTQDAPTNQPINMEEWRWAGAAPPREPPGGNDLAAFVRGAHLAPHSSEIDLHSSQSTADSVDSLAAHGAKANSEPRAHEQTNLSSQSLVVILPPSTSSYEELPTRDVGLLHSSLKASFSTDIFLAGSYKNDPMKDLESENGDNNSRNESENKTDRPVQSVYESNKENNLQHFSVGNSGFYDKNMIYENSKLQLSHGLHIVSNSAGARNIPPGFEGQDEHFQTQNNPHVGSMSSINTQFSSSGNNMTQNSRGGNFVPRNILNQSPASNINLQLSHGLHIVAPSDGARSIPPGFEREDEHFQTVNNFSQNYPHVGNTSSINTQFSSSGNNMTQNSHEGNFVPRNILNRSPASNINLLCTSPDGYKYPPGFNIPRNSTLGYNIPHSTPCMLKVPEHPQRMSSMPHASPHMPSITNSSPPPMSPHAGHNIPQNLPIGYNIPVPEFNPNYPPPGFNAIYSPPVQIVNNAQGPHIMPQISPLGHNLPRNAQPSETSPPSISPGGKTMPQSHSPGKPKVSSGGDSRFTFNVDKYMGQFNNANNNVGQNIVQGKDKNYGDGEGNDRVTKNIGNQINKDTENNNLTGNADKRLEAYLKSMIERQDIANNTNLKGLEEAAYKTCSFINNMNVRNEMPVQAKHKVMINEDTVLNNEENAGQIDKKITNTVSEQLKQSFKIKKDQQTFLKDLIMFSRNDMIVKDTEAGRYYGDHNLNSNDNQGEMVVNINDNVFLEAKNMEDFNNNNTRQLEAQGKNARPFAGSYGNHNENFITTRNNMISEDAQNSNARQRCMWYDNLKCDSVDIQHKTINSEVARIGCAKQDDNLNNGCTSLVKNDGVSKDVNNVQLAKNDFLLGKNNNVFAKGLGVSSEHIRVPGKTVTWGENRGNNLKVTIVRNADSIEAEDNRKGTISEDVENNPRTDFATANSREDFNRNAIFCELVNGRSANERNKAILSEIMPDDIKRQIDIMNNKIACRDNTGKIQSFGTSPVNRANICDQDARKENTGVNYAHGQTCPGLEQACQNQGQVFANTFRNLNFNETKTDLNICGRSTSSPAQRDVCPNYKDAYNANTFKAINANRDSKMYGTQEQFRPCSDRVSQNCESQTHTRPNSCRVSDIPEIQGKSLPNRDLGVYETGLNTKRVASLHEIQGPTRPNTIRASSLHEIHEQTRQNTSRDYNAYRGNAFQTYFNSATNDCNNNKNTLANKYGRIDKDINIMYPNSGGMGAKLEDREEMFMGKGRGHAFENKIEVRGRGRIVKKVVMI